MERRHIAIHRMQTTAPRRRSAKRETITLPPLGPPPFGTANACPYNTKENTIMLMYKKAASLAALGVLCAAQPVVAQEPNASQSLGIPANEVKYKDLGGPQLGTVWGDSATGAHGSFLRLHRGF